MGALALRTVLQHGYMCTYCEQLLNYDVLAKNKKSIHAFTTIRVQGSTKVCSLPLATLKDWQFWMFLCHKAHFLYFYLTLLLYDSVK